MTPLIRQADASDLEAILGIYAQEGFDAGETVSLEAARRLFERMQAYPFYRLYVAELGREIVGAFALLIMDNLGHCGAPSAIVEDLVVTPRFQRQGIGRSMMEWAMEAARSVGCYKLVLSSAEGRVGAHAFYESLGFEPHGVSFLITVGESESAKAARRLG